MTLRITALILLLNLGLSCKPANARTWITADSIYLFSYAQPQNSGRTGLQFAWSRDAQHWKTIGDQSGFVRSDYGRWGAQKKMITPWLIQGPDMSWHCVWQLNSEEPVFALVSSKDLLYWGPQSYPKVAATGTCLHPVIRYDVSQKTYLITYTDKNRHYYQVQTTDFKHYTAAKPVSQDAYHFAQVEVHLPTGNFKGQLHKVSWKQAAALIAANDLNEYHSARDRESAATDPARFAGLKTIDASLTFNPDQTKPISNLLIGAFFEDLNYAADGGLYGELIQNRNFEYRLSDKEGRDTTWNAMHSWQLTGQGTQLKLDSVEPIHVNNPHYVLLTTQEPGAKLSNNGYDGIPLIKNAAYDLSLFVKSVDPGKHYFKVRLVNPDGTVLATTNLNTSSTHWKKLEVKLIPNADAKAARLELEPITKGKLALDMVSLFPENTFHHRKNGLRADIASAVADLHPKFLRFPGGCLVHGDGLGNIYRWKNTIGPLESRRPDRNLWGYHQSMGLGYFEYFQFCEDIGAQPVPVIAAGVPCQNSATGGGGQQGGIPIDQMPAYIQDILDLIEYANGDKNSTWGKKRAEAGHPAPFNLKYIGIGNEDLISDVFEIRFSMIYAALKKAHPEITVIGTVGPNSDGTDYTEGWRIADSLQVPMVDEHYYKSPGWFIYNQDFYDKYDRTHSKVYLGEYAAHLPGKPVNVETALSEALYLTSIERNGDIVHMASYAPLLAREGYTDWNPNLIYFNGQQVHLTTGYQVQKLFGQNSGYRYTPGQLQLSNEAEKVRVRVGFSMVRDTVSGDQILKLINLLPVAIDLTTDLSPWIKPNSNVSATKTIFTGAPTDKKALPESKDVTIEQKPVMKLPPYSFTLIRFNGGM